MRWAVRSLAPGDSNFGRTGSRRSGNHPTVAPPVYPDHTHPPTAALLRTLSHAGRLPSPSFLKAGTRPNNPEPHHHH